MQYVVAKPPPYADPVTGRPLAEWWRRALACLLDGAILGVPLWLVQNFLVFGLFSSIHIPSRCTAPNPPSSCTQQVFHAILHGIGPWFLGVVLASTVIQACYYTILVASRRGQSVGMMALGIAVRDERGDASVGLGRSLVRWLVVLALTLPLGIPLLIDYLSPLWDSRRQAWHDHAAGSVVVLVR